MNKRPHRWRSAQTLALISLASISTPGFSAPLVSFDTLKDRWGHALIGAASTLVIHELGHFAAAEIEGTNAYLDGVTIRYRETDLNNRQALRLSSAGFHSQWLASEYGFYQLTQSGKSEAQQAFSAGMVLGHLGISLAYLTILKNHKDGDLHDSAIASGISQDKLLGGLIIPAALDGWRLFGDAPQWAPWVSRGAKAFGIAWSWSH